MPRSHRLARFNVVLLPLDDAASARFNETKAMAWVESVVGLNYGYSVLFWGWIDTLADNYPCAATSGNFGIISVHLTRAFQPSTTLIESPIVPCNMFST